MDIDAQVTPHITKQDARNVINALEQLQTSLRNTRDEIAIKSVPHVHHCIALLNKLNAKPESVGVKGVPDNLEVPATLVRDALRYRFLRQPHARLSRLMDVTLTAFDMRVDNLMLQSLPQVEVTGGITDTHSPTQ